MCVICLKPWCIPGLKSQHISTHKQHVQSRIYTTQAYKFHTTPSPHSSNPGPSMLSRPLLVRLRQLFISGCPEYLLDKLQKVQNTATRLVCKAKKSDQIHPVLETLLWLPGTRRNQYKISTICFSSISGTSPHCLSDLLQPYTQADNDDPYLKHEYLSPLV